MKYLVIAFVLLLSGCGDSGPVDPKFSYEGLGRDQLSADHLYETCIKGVVYYNRTSVHNTWFAPAFDKNTKQVRLCD